MEKIQDIIITAIENLYKYDYELILNTRNKKRYHVSERGIVCKIMHYISTEIENSEIYKKYKVDVEYNRNENEIKRLMVGNAIPDLVIHERGSNENNLVILEFKTFWNKKRKSSQKDKQRLIEFKNNPYNYKHAGFIIIEEKKSNYLVEWINE